MLVLNQVFSLIPSRTLSSKIPSYALLVRESQTLSSLTSFGSGKEDTATNLVEICRWWFSNSHFPVSPRSVSNALQSLWTTHGLYTHHYNCVDFPRGNVGFQGLVRVFDSWGSRGEESSRYEGTKEHSRGRMQSLLLLLSLHKESFVYLQIPQLIQRQRRRYPTLNLSIRYKWQQHASHFVISPSPPKPRKSKWELAVVKENRSYWFRNSKGCPFEYVSSLPFGHLIIAFAIEEQTAAAARTAQSSFKLGSINSNNCYLFKPPSDICNRNLHPIYTGRQRHWRPQNSEQQQHHFRKQQQQPRTK